MGCSLGKHAKKEAEEENLVDKPAEKNEENVLFERPAAGSGENAQEPLLPDDATEVAAKEPAPDTNAEMDSVKDEPKEDDSLTAEVAKAMAASSVKIEEPALSETTVTKVTTETHTTSHHVDTKGDKVENKAVSDDINATAIEVASEVVKSVTEECKTMVTREVSKVSSSTSEKVSKQSSGASETINRTSGDVSETITKHTSSASESVSKLSCSSTQEYTSMVTSSVSKFTDAQGNEIESTPIVEVKEDVVTEVKEKSEQSSKTIEEVIDDAKQAAEEKAAQNVAEGTADISTKVEETVMPVVEEGISEVITTAKESVPSSLLDAAIPVTVEHDAAVVQEPSIAISSDVDVNKVEELVQESSTDAPAVVEEAAVAPVEVDLTETSVDSGKIAEADITETSVDAMLVPSNDLQETSVDSGAVQEAITETSVDSLLESSPNNFPPPPAVEGEEAVVEKAEDIFKSEHEKQVEASQILAADMMTAEVPSALPSPKGAYEEDILMLNEQVEFYSKDNVEPIVEEGKQEVPLLEAPVSEPIEVAPEAVQEIEPVEALPEVVEETEPVEAVPEVVQETEPVKVVPEVVQETEPIETVPEGVQETEPVETVPEVIPETEPVETVPEVVPETEPVETVPESVQETQPVETVPEVVQETQPVETVPEVVPETEPVETVPEGVQETQPVETVPEVVQETQPVETVPEVVPETEPVETVPEVVPETEPVETAPEVVPETEPVETAPEVVPETEPVETVPEVLPETEPVETVPEVVPETEPVETVPEVVPETEPVEAVPEGVQETQPVEAVPEGIEEIKSEETEGELEEKPVEQTLSEKPEVCDVPMNENVEAESEEVVDSKVENDNVLAEASTIPAVISEGLEQTESDAASEAVVTSTPEETETAEVISQEEKADVAAENLPVIENNETTEVAESEIVSNGPEQPIDITGPSEEVSAGTTAANLVESVLDSVKSEIAAVMEASPAQKSATLSENELDNELSSSQDIQSLPNGENQVQTLEETGQDPVDGCVDYEDRFYNNASFKRGAGGSNQTPASETLEVAHSTVDGQSGENAPGPNENDAAVKIQAGYKGYKARKEVKEMKMKTNAATKIQAGFRGHKTRKHLKTAKDGDEASHPHASHHHHHHHRDQVHRNEQHIHHIHNMPNISTHQSLNPSDDENNKMNCGNDIHRAATKIQAGFRGFRARQQMKVMKVKANAEQALPAINPEDPRVHEAATKIQAMIRGRKARKEMKVLRLQNKRGHGRHHHGHGHAHHAKSSKSHNRSGQAQNKNGREEPKATENANNDIDIDPNNLELNEAATKIQAGFRGHTVRKRISKTITADTDANNSAIKKDNDIDIDLTDPEVSAAATKIQANFRGHHTRQKLKDTPKVIPSSTDEEQHPEPVEKKEDVKTEPEEIDIDLTDPEVEAAAQKIQASFRGHLKSKRKQTISKEEESEEKETIASSEKAHVEKEDSSAVGGSPTISSGGVQKGDYEEVSEVKEKEEEEEEKVKEVIDMKPTEQTAEKVREHSGSVSEGDKTDKNEDGSTADGTEVKKEVVPAEMKAASTTAATPQPTEAEEVDIDLTDPDVAAATKKLQAGFRGRLNRRKKAQENALAAASTDEESDSNRTPTPTSHTPTQTPVEVQSTAAKSSEIDDINLNDPELAAAAVKIQASFRGHITRKDRKKTEDVEEESNSNVTTTQISHIPTPTQVEVQLPVTKSSEVDDINLNDPELAAAAVKIQASFRGHITRKDRKKTEDVEEKSNTNRTPTPNSHIPTPVEVQSTAAKSSEIDDINLNDPELAAAAVKIQASFRGHITRKDRKKTEDVEEESNTNRTPTPNSHIPTPVEVQSTAANSSEIDDINLNDPELAAAAVKIQASFRGHITRKDRKKTEDVEEESNLNPTPTQISHILTPTPVEVQSTAAKSSEIDDINLNDPELAAAAVKIQASFRGHITRKDRKKTEDVEPPSEEAAMSQKSNDGVATCDDATTGDQGQKDDKSINYKDPQVHLAAAKIQAGFKGYQTRKSLKKQAGNSEEAEKDSGS